MESSDPLDPLFLINRVVDVLFLFDMFLNFFTAYYNELSGKWEFNHHMIIHRYLKGWCVPNVSRFTLTAALYICLPVDVAAGCCPRD